MDNLGSIAGLVITNIIVWSLIGFLIKRAREKSIEKKNAKKQKKMQQKKAEELRIEQEKKDKELEKQRKENEKEMKVYLQVYDFAKATLALFFKKAEEIEWIMNNKINLILLDMPIKRLEVARQNFVDNGKITELGPYKISREQLYSWHKEYLNAKSQKEYEEKQAQEEAKEKNLAKRKIEAEKERISNRVKAEKERKWQEYVAKFRRYNSAQQKSELKWFQDKLYNNFTNNQDEKDLYIHELEMIMLENKKDDS